MQEQVYNYMQHNYDYIDHECVRWPLHTYVRYHNKIIQHHISPDSATTRSRKGAIMLSIPSQSLKESITCDAVKLGKVRLRENLSVSPSELSPPSTCVCMQ